MNWCKFFGHKWIEVYIGKDKKWRLISVYCRRCGYGKVDISNFLKTNEHTFGTYSEKYFKEAGK